MTFTKEQLIKRANYAVERYTKAKIGFPDQLGVAMDLELARIALAALTAEPVAWTDEQELRDVEKSGCGYLFTVNPITPNADPRRVIKIYRLPEID